MSARQAMTQRCTIERKASASDGGGGRTLTWSSHLTALPCAAWTDRAQTVVSGEKITTIEQRCLIVPLGSDVTQDDRIAQVTDRRGNVLFAGPMPIVSVGHRRDHLQLYVRELA